jgi:hypothetical protein
VLLGSLFDVGKTPRRSVSSPAGLPPQSGRPRASSGGGGIADPLLSNLDSGQTPATPRPPRTRSGGQGLGARLRVPDGTLKRCGARIRLRPPVPDRPPRFGEAVGGESREGFSGRMMPVARHGAEGGRGLEALRRSQACRARQSPALERSPRDLVGDTKPMEGSNVASLATVERHHGLVGGAKPCSWLLRVLSTGSPARLPRWSAAHRGVFGSFGRRTARLSRPRARPESYSRSLAQVLPPSPGT